MGGITKIFFSWKKRSLSVLFAHFSRKSSYMKSKVTGRRRHHHSPPPQEILTPTESHSIFQLYIPGTKERIPSIRTFLSIPLSNTLSYNFIGNPIWATLHLLLFPKCYSIFPYIVSYQNLSSPLHISANIQFKFPTFTINQQAHYYCKVSPEKLVLVLFFKHISIRTDNKWICVYIHL